MARCRHTDGPEHDCSYVDARNALIPAAERHANKFVPISSDSEFAARWTLAFMTEMDRLWRTRGRS
jgi:hypothetical protein